MSALDHDAVRARCEPIVDETGEVVATVQVRGPVSPETTAAIRALVEAAKARMDSEVGGHKTGTAVPALLEENAALTADRDAALAEVQRLTKVLAGARVEHSKQISSLRTELAEARADRCPVCDHIWATHRPGGCLYTLGILASASELLECPCATPASTHPTTPVGDQP